MAADLLERSLRHLHESLGNDIAKKNQAIAVVSDLSQICSQEVTDKEIDLVCSTLFDKENGILKFLSKAVVDDGLQHCKAKVLEFLCEFLDRVDKKILPYAVEIKDVCVSLFSRDKYAKVKNAAMALLSKILEVGSTLRDDLQIDKLITKFFNELTKGSKLTPTVKEKIYIILGIIAEIYPEFMTPYSERLIGIYLGALKIEMNSKTRKPELSMISGCIEGLNCTLMNFTESAEEGSKYSYEIYKYTRNSIDPTVELTRYDMPRAGLRLLHRHASQFNQYLLDDYENMYNKLSYWCHHNNSEMSLLGLKAVESFLTQISEMLKEKAMSGTQDGGGIFKFFIRQFRDIANSEKSTTKELSLAIKGYGLLAGPCAKYMKQSDVQFMFTEMLTKTEQQFVRQPEDLENKLHNLPSYLECLGSIVKEMDTLAESYAMSLEHLMVLLVENMPNIHNTKHFLCQRSILWVLLALMSKGTTFKQVLSGFVYQSLIRTCSHLPIIETENETETTEDEPHVKKITYKDYIDTWIGLLDAPLIKDFAKADISLETRRQLSDVLYNEIVSSVIRMIDRLDLSSTFDQQTQEAEAGPSTESNVDTGLTGADPLLGVQASRPKDFQIFINLVDFCKDLLPLKHYNKFECWIFPFTHKLILLSSDNPLASGFYKLLSVCMKIANKVNFFKGINELEKEDIKTETMDIDITDHVGHTQKYFCTILLKKFLKEVLVRLKQYRDDLLASCLTFILSLPQEIIIDQMLDIVPAIQVTLTIGLSYLPLALIAMDALEFWSSSLPKHVMLPFYDDILPYLDNYLKTTNQGSEEVSVDSTVSMYKKKSGRGRQKLSVRLIKGKKSTSSTQNYQSQLSEMKERIMIYLGSLGGSINQCIMSKSDEQIARQAITWDNVQHLKFDMPFVDMKPTIYLDPFLPRVIELATTSSYRQTKVAACELFHSLVIYAVGQSTTQPGVDVQRVSMSPLFKHIFPAILKLACDVEQVAKQLFEPLTMQLIHWFTNSKKTESDETMRLLDSIYDGMIQQSDTGLRDFSAKCLQEFLKWSIKQTSTKIAETNPANAKSVLKRLFSYALHPSTSKRMAASLAFNNIYTVFREEEPLVDMFTFQLLVVFVDSLAIAHHDEKSLGTQTQCCKALTHVEKIIKHKAGILKNISKNRVEPKNWSSITLDIAVRWLTRQCGRPQTECRHACMKLAFNLCTLLGGVKTPVKYFQGCLKKKDAWFWIERFEGGGSMSNDDDGGIYKYPTLQHLSDQQYSLQTTLLWFDYMLAALDCYTWVFGENLLSPQELFGVKLKSGKFSNIFVSIEYFISKIAMATIEDVSQLYGTGHSMSGIFTPREKDEFNKAKCTVIVRLLSFLTVMLAKFSKETINVTPKSVWCTVLWDLMLSCIIKPSIVGFNLGDVEIIKNLPLEMSQTLQVFSKVFKADLTRHFTSAFTGDRNIFTMLPVDFADTSSDNVMLEQQFSGYLLLHDVNMLSPCLPGQKHSKFATQLLDNVFKGIVTDTDGYLSTLTLTPTILSLAKTMLKLALSMGIQMDTFFDRIFDSTLVSQDSNKTGVQCRGDLFVSTFKTTLSWYIVTSAVTIIPGLIKYAEKQSTRVCTLLTAAVDFVTKDRTDRKRYGPTLLKVILESWSQLSCWWGTTSSIDQITMALMLLRKLLLIDSKFVSSSTDMFSMYQSMLTDTRINLALKCQVLDLLPFFVNISDQQTTKLRTSLDRLVADSFPLRSSELTPGTPKYNDYISAIDKILSGFQLSGSLMLLEFLITIFCREQQHIHENAIQNAIAKFTQRFIPFNMIFKSRLPRDKQAAAVDVPYKIFLKTNFPSEIRRATIERVCLPMVRLVNKSVVLEFFSDHIVQLKDLLSTNLGKSESTLEVQLITRIGCFQLLESMYSRLYKDELVGMTSTINKIFTGNNVQNGKELTSFVSRIAHEAKSEDIRGETTLLPLRRQYHCAAYNLMVAFVSRTQTEMKFYTAFLFEEKEFKGQFLLENLVDKDRVYEFEVEFKSPMERKKRFVTLHEEAKQQRHSEDNDSYDDVSPSIHLASQYLYDSSLRDDVSQYFSMSATVESYGSGGDKKTRKQVFGSSNGEEKESSVSMNDDYIELEMDSINQHECMATMVALINHMKEKKITPEVAAGTEAPPLPSWMEKLHTKLSNSKTHYNIKLFIAKLIMNTAKVFEPYSRHWLQPLIQLIVTGPLGSGNINYFVVDLIITLLSWHKTAIPQDTVEDKALTSRLIHFVVKNIYHDSRPVFRNNLEMFKTLLECWKGRFDIPYQEVYTQFSKPDLKSRDNTVGIQVLGVILACKLPPYGPSAPVDRDRYFVKIAYNMGNSYKTIYAPAAEVCGMVFYHLGEDKKEEKDESFHSYVTNMMSDLHQSKPDNFITCVHRMQKYYPPIADRFLNKLLFMLPGLHGEYKTLCLEVIQSRIDNIDNVFLELQSKGLLSCITHRDEATQLVSLKIIKSILPKLKCGEVSILIPLIVGFSGNPSTGCRIIMYDILMWTYDNYRYEDTEEGHKIILLTKECLLKGLVDDDLHCRLQVQNFWSSETRLPTGTLDRLVAMLEAMYSPVTEQQYLSYATNLLLEMTSKSPDYQREIFDKPLSECKFSDCSIKSSWRHRHAAMTPLFATLSSQADVLDNDDSMEGVRATQDVLQFSQTQAGTSKGPFNWLTQSSLDTYADATNVAMDTQTSQSSLLFNVGTSESQSSGTSRSRSKPGPGFGKQKLPEIKKTTAGNKEKDIGDRSELYRLKRRFLKDKEQSSLYFAKENIRIKQMREIAQKEQKVRRENQVTLYRKYRAGDLPDIQIKYSYIIAPLQALAHRDSLVAKLLMSGIFQAIFAQIEEIKTEREMTECIDQINKSLDHILSQSTIYYPPFVACMLDILYNLRNHLKVDVSSIGSSCIYSKLQPLGISVLEERLIQYDPGESRATKRRRVEVDVPVSSDVNHWIELARLYKSLEEYDVLMGIFSGKIGTLDITRHALESEGRGDYYNARKLYAEALNPEITSLDDSVNQAEIDLLEDGRMKCLKYLSQWETLQKVSESTIESSSLTDVWEDTYLQENVLPYLIKSKLKLMLHGDEGQQPLLNFIDTSMRIPEHKLVLENSYCEELALMYLWQEDYDRARHYCNIALQAFLQEWSSTDTLMMNSRTRAIQKLQPLIEMQEFLKFISDENNFHTLLPSQKLLRSWNQRMPHLYTDPVTVWDDIVTNRSVYLDRISSGLQKHNDSISEDMEDMFLDTKLKLKLDMVNCSKEQNNFHLALKILGDIRSDCKDIGGEMLCKWTHLYSSTHHKNTSADKWSEESLHKIYGTLDQLGKVSENEALTVNPNLGRHHYILTGQSIELLVLGVKSLDSINEDSKVGKKLLEYTGLKKFNKTELTEKLVSDGYNKIKSSISYDDNSSTTEILNGVSKPGAYLATAKYCDSILRMKEDDSDETPLQVGKKCLESFPETLIVCMLNGMKLNCEEALQRFPRLLQIIELYPNTMTTFISKCNEVPDWMFISWISQMLAILDKPEAKAVHRILEKITDSYPQAVVYPMKLSREGYSFGQSKGDKLNQDVVNRLCSKLGPQELPLAHRFISSLECFGQPDQEFKDSFEEMVKKMRKGHKTEVIEIYKKLYARILDYKKKEQVDVKKSQKSQRKGGGDTTSVIDDDDDDDCSQIMMDSLTDIGSYAKKFADKFKADIDKIFGNDGRNIAGMSVKTLGGHIDTLIKQLAEAAKGPLQPPLKLVEYSKWMSNFKPNVNRMILELPGQYTGLTKPLPEYHVKIAGFDERINVMSSIRKPKKLVIRGNDEREYPFLVKGGEDLRQDQRIEQLFYRMNQTFYQNSTCRSLKLKLKTYQVIPMTPRVGLIEWVSNTIPLKDFILDSLTDPEKKTYNGKQGPNVAHVTWIKKVCKDKDVWAQKYHNVYSKYSKTETIRQFAETESKVPWDLFRRSFQHLSTSPEAFHVLRCRSMQSHAVICICQYILGIGDRHQSNFMVNLKTGEMVGIDFGHAFGSATQFLPVPELVPFRLTRQFCNLMLPLQVDGLLKNTMIHVLRALKYDADLLLNTMDIFVKEPSLDWKQNAERQVQSMRDDDIELYSQEEELQQWYPKQKIHYVKRKLQGENSAYITRDELRLGHAKKEEAFQNFEMVVLGKAHKNARADLPSHGLTVEQQVAVLIDQATDPNILGRTWIGWEPWV
ncbi:hypothetical protein ACF0H5_000995 [Mactra antiquata]